MHNEAAEASAVVARQFDANAERVQEAVARIREFDPQVVVTMARGSSDHAAMYGKYLIETQLGLVVASAAPSVSSVYQVPQKLDRALYIAISQSGASPDLLASVRQAKEAGALTLALVNVEDSPLAELVDIVLPLRAGKENSVAATKSYIATLSGLLHLVSEWSGRDALLTARNELSAQLAQAWELDWTDAGVSALKDARNLFVIGRGLGFGIALEAALKFKETCGLHAEGFSAAEVKHGPMAIVNEGFPVLAIAQEDDTRAAMDELVKEYRARGAVVLYASQSEPGNLPVVADANPITAPILAVQSFYRMVNGLSVARGHNPDTPPHLNKVTETV